MKFREEFSAEVLRKERNALHGSRFSGNFVSVNRNESIIRRIQPRFRNGEKPRKKWVVGEKAEVLESDFWRAGKVLKVMKNERLVFKFFGSIELKELHAACLRIRRVRPKERSSSNLLNDQQDELRIVKKDEPNDGLSSNECSVASCSLNETVDFNERSNQLRFETTFQYSEAESSSPALSCAKNKCQFKAQKSTVIRNLELEAYKSTIQALFASGPLSWEQESLLTNLRLSLHISNDEHLLQVRHLLSA